MNGLGPCLEHCYKQNAHCMYCLLFLFSILIGIIIGINPGIMMKSKGVAFDFNVEFENTENSNKN